MIWKESHREQEHYRWTNINWFISMNNMYFSFSFLWSVFKHFTYFLRLKDFFNYIIFYVFNFLNIFYFNHM